VRAAGRGRGRDGEGAAAEPVLYGGGALANVEQPKVVRDVHREFYEAAERGGWTGDVYATTNNFVATPFHLGESYLEYVRAAARNATEAASDPRATSRRKVAGSLPPLGECYGLPGGQGLVETYRQIAEALLEGGRIDVFLAETLTTIGEATAALEAVRSLRTSVWISFTLADDDTARLRGGETLAEAVRTLTSLPHVDGLGVNCSHVRAVDGALDSLLEHPLRHVIAYANDFPGASTSTWLRSVGKPDCCRLEDDFCLTTTSSRGPAGYADACARWLFEKGVTVLGGCCGVRPAHIEAVARRLAINGDADSAARRLPAVARDLIDVSQPLFGHSQQALAELRLGRFVDLGAESFRVVWRRRWWSGLGADYFSPDGLWTLVSGMLSNAVDGEPLDRAADHISRRLVAAVAESRTNVFLHVRRPPPTHLVACRQIIALACALLRRHKGHHLGAPILRRIHAFLKDDLSYFRGTAFLCPASAEDSRDRRCGVITSDGLVVAIELAAPAPLV